MPEPKYSSSFKVRFVLGGLRSPDGIAPYCRRQGVSEQQFYTWQRQMLENADALFTPIPEKAARKIAQLEEQLKQKDSIIVAVTAEAIDLKKKRIK